MHLNSDTYVRTVVFPRVVLRERGAAGGAGKGGGEVTLGLPALRASNQSILLDSLELQVNVGEVEVGRLVTDLSKG